MRKANSTFSEFFDSLRKQTESTWKSKEYIPEIYGYQVAIGTKWLPGHSEIEISEILNRLDIKEEFKHEDLVALLSLTKGLSLPQTNLNSQTLGAKTKQNWKLNSQYILSTWSEHKQDMEEHGELQALSLIVEEPHIIIPLYLHRYIVLTKKDLKVYSIHGEDIIIYGNSLQEYLEKEFFTK